MHNLDPTQSVGQAVGQVVRYSADGTYEVYTPGSETPAANWAALNQAATDAVQYDTVVCDEYAEYESPAGASITISQPDVTLKKGLITRAPGQNYLALVTLAGANRSKLVDCILDGEVEFDAPTTLTVPADFNQTNPNNTANASLLKIENSHAVRVENCLFRRHAGTIAPAGGGSVQRYVDAAGITIDSNCEAVTVAACDFYKMGSYGVNNQGWSTSVKGSTFTDILSWGVINGGPDLNSVSITGCMFTKTTATSFGPTGGINFNRGSSGLTYRHADISHCVFNLGAVPAQLVAGTESSALIKLQDVVHASVRGCTLLRPQTSTTAGSGIMIEGTVSFLEIHDSYIQGILNHISRTGRPRVRIVGSKLGVDITTSWAVLGFYEDISLEGSELYYTSRAIAGDGLSDPNTIGAFAVSGSLECDKCRFNPDGAGPTQVLIAADFPNEKGKLRFDNSNTIAGSLHGSGTHSKSDTPEGNLALTSVGENPLAKCHDATLTGNQAHPSFGGAPHYAPSFAGEPCMTIQNAQWADSGGLSPSSATEVRSWHWSTTGGGEWIAEF